MGSINERLPSEFSTSFRRLTLIFVTAAASITALDASVVMILVEPIKRDLALSDTQMGLILGLALSLVSALASLPFSRWADVGVRRSVLTVALLVCSVGTVAIGFAQGFWAFLAARIAQGIGVGGGGTPGQSVLADLYPPQKRAGALAVLMVGSTAATTIGTTVAALVAEAYGWRLIFWVLGAPGLLLAVAIRALMVEPARPATGDGESHALPLGAALRNLARRRTFRHVTIGMMLLTFGIMGLFGWAAPYLMRSFDKTLTQVAPIVGIGFGGALVLGNLAGGALGDRLARSDLRWQLWIPVGSSASSVPFLAGYLFLPSYPLAVASGLFALCVMGLYSAPLQAAVLGSVDPRARAISLAVMGLFTSGVGAAGGVFTVGALSDWFAPTLGDGSLRWAIAALLPACLWSSLHFWIASKHYAEEAERPEAAA